MRSPSVHQIEDRAQLDREAMVVCDLSTPQLMEYICGVFPQADAEYVATQVNDLCRQVQIGQIGQATCKWSVVENDGTRIKLCVGKLPLRAHGSTHPERSRRVFEIVPGQPHPTEVERIKQQTEALSRRARKQEVSRADLEVDMPELRDVHFDSASVTLTLPSRRRGEREVDVFLERGDDLSGPAVYVAKAVYAETQTPLRLDIPNVRARVFTALARIDVEDIDIEGRASIQIGDDGLAHFEE